MWCDGGPVIGVQLENEYDRTGPGAGAEHIAELKRLAIGAGSLVPPVHGDRLAHARHPAARGGARSPARIPDGFWRGETGPLPPSSVFLFNASRADRRDGPRRRHAGAAMQIDKAPLPVLPRRGRRRHARVLPPATGGRRRRRGRHAASCSSARGRRCTATTCTTAALNPTTPGRAPHEHRRSGYPNDVPVLGYDFRAPLGQYGQLPRVLWPAAHAAPVLRRLRRGARDAGTGAAADAPPIRRPRQRLRVGRARRGPTAASSSSTTTCGTTRCRTSSSVRLRVQQR